MRSWTASTILGPAWTISWRDSGWRARQGRSRRCWKARKQRLRKRHHHHPHLPRVADNDCRRRSTIGSTLRNLLGSVLLCHCEAREDSQVSTSLSLASRIATLLASLWCLPNQRRTTAALEPLWKLVMLPEGLDQPRDASIQRSVPFAYPKVHIHSDPPTAYNLIPLPRTLQSACCI
jgi:hypothetical protein